MDSIQTWFESLPLCVHSALWKWSKSEKTKNIIYFGVFTEKSLRSVTLGSLITIMNVHGFHPNLAWCIPTVPSFIPVNMSKIWGIKKYHLLWCFHRQSLRSVTLGSLISSMNVHGFHPNLKWSILTVPSFIPVNMSKIWGIKNFTFVLNIF